ncbi:MAG: CheY-like chemotaxis protein [Verrucomicrobiales bacterium]|jgi:CheY-like chemotaxis protein
MTMDTVIQILLVEDDEIDARAIKRGLAKQSIGNRLTHALDGVEALKILRGEGGHSRLPRPYIILLDINMPRMNGLEFLAEIRKDPELKPSIVFVLTTSDDDRDKVAAYGNNVAGYLVKSDAGQDFIKVVQMLEKFVIAIHFPPDVPVEV